MPRFAYLAVDPTGAERRGAIQAVGQAVAAERLAARRWHVVRLAEESAPVAAPAAGAGLFGNLLRPRLSSKQLALFTRQLASLMTVAPLEEALRTISRQSETAKLRAILGTVHDGIVEGLPLAEAMRREEASFPPVYRAMVAAGEGSGTLPTIAERLAALLERQGAVRSRIVAALAYPLVLSLVAMGVVTGLMISVVPRVVEQFDNAAAELPLLTRAVIAVSRFLGSWWWALLALAALLIAMAVRALAHPPTRLRVDAALLRLPLIGRVLRDVAAAGVARTLGTMIAARLPLVDALRLASHTAGNRVHRLALEEIAGKVRAGGSFSAALRDAGCFPPLVVYLAAGGETSGQLGDMLERAADYLDREFESFSSAALALLEPAIIVVMGAMVATIILAILLPILQLQTLAGVG